MKDAEASRVEQVFGLDCSIGAPLLVKNGGYMDAERGRKEEQQLAIQSVDFGRVSE